ncbi:MAG: DUF1648 domain-containing protein [Gemmatimonadota bacterium]|nr:DUF1648 domain-containing protein [Gemmatimonadota bacterium]
MSGWRWTAVAMLVGTLGLLAWVYPDLPDPMGTQFTFDGTPVRWTPRPQFIVAFGLVAALINLLFLGGIPEVLRRTGATRFNVPNRDYWLATPERRTEALRRMCPFLARSAVFANTLLLLCLHLVAQWNGARVLVRIPAALTGPLLLGTAGGGVFVLIVWAFHDFAVPAPPLGVERAAR